MAAKQAKLVLSFSGQKTTSVADRKSGDPMFARGKRLHLHLIDIVLLSESSSPPPRHIPEDLEIMWSCFNELG